MNVGIDQTGHQRSSVEVDSNAALRGPGPGRLDLPDGPVGDHNDSVRQGFAAGAVDYKGVGEGYRVVQGAPPEPGEWGKKRYSVGPLLCGSESKVNRY
jgi:hypothetical protein